MQLKVVLRQVKTLSSITYPRWIHRQLPTTLNHSSIVSCTIPSLILLQYWKYLLLCIFPSISALLISINFLRIFLSSLLYTLDPSTSNYSTSYLPPHNVNNRCFCYSYTSLAKYYALLVGGQKYHILLPPRSKYTPPLSEIYSKTVASRVLSRPVHWCRGCGG